MTDQRTFTGADGGFTYSLDVTYTPPAPPPPEPEPTPPLMLASLNGEPLSGERGDPYSSEYAAQGFKPCLNISGKSLFLDINDPPSQGKLGSWSRDKTDAMLAAHSGYEYVIVDEEAYLLPIVNQGQTHRDYAWAVDQLLECYEYLQSQGLKVGPYGIPRGSHWWEQNDAWLDRSRAQAVIVQACDFLPAHCYDRYVGYGKDQDTFGGIMAMADEIADGKIPVVPMTRHRYPNQGAHGHRLLTDAEYLEHQAWCGAAGRGVCLWSMEWYNIAAAVGNGNSQAAIRNREQYQLEFDAMGLAMTLENRAEFTRRTHERVIGLAKQAVTG